MSWDDVGVFVIFASIAVIVFADVAMRALNCPDSYSGLLGLRECWRRRHDEN